MKNFLFLFPIVFFTLPLICQNQSVVILGNEHFDEYRGAKRDLIVSVPFLGATKVVFKKLPENHTTILVRLFFGEDPDGEYFKVKEFLSSEDEEDMEKEFHITKLKFENENKFTVTTNSSFLIQNNKLPLRSKRIKIVVYIKDEESQNIKYKRIGEYKLELIPEIKTAIVPKILEIPRLSINSQEKKTENFENIFLGILPVQFNSRNSKITDDIEISTDKKDLPGTFLGTYEEELNAIKLFFRPEIKLFQGQEPKYLLEYYDSLDLQNEIHKVQLGFKFKVKDGTEIEDSVTIPNFAFYRDSGGNLSIWVYIISVFGILGFLIFFILWVLLKKKQNKTSPKELIKKMLNFFNRKEQVQDKSLKELLKSVDKGDKLSEIKFCYHGFNDAKLFLKNQGIEISSSIENGSGPNGDQSSGDNDPDISENTAFSIKYGLEQYGLNCASKIKYKYEKAIHLLSGSNETLVTDSLVEFETNEEAIKGLGETIENSLKETHPSIQVIGDKIDELFTDHENGVVPNDEKSLKGILNNKFTIGLKRQLDLLVEDIEKGEVNEDKDNKLFVGIIDRKVTDGLRTPFSTILDYNKYLNGDINKLQILTKTVSYNFADLQKYDYRKKGSFDDFGVLAKERFIELNNKDGGDQETLQEQLDIWYDDFYKKEGFVSDRISLSDFQNSIQVKFPNYPKPNENVNNNTNTVTTSDISEDFLNKVIEFSQWKIEKLLEEMREWYNKFQNKEQEDLTQFEKQFPENQDWEFIINTLKNKAATNPLLIKNLEAFLSYIDAKITENGPEEPKDPLAQDLLKIRNEIIEKIKTWVKQLMDLNNESIITEPEAAKLIIEVINQVEEKTINYIGQNLGTSTNGFNHNNLKKLEQPHKILLQINKLSSETHGKGNLERKVSSIINKIQSWTSNDKDVQDLEKELLSDLVEVATSYVEKASKLTYSEQVDTSNKEIFTPNTLLYLNRSKKIAYQFGEQKFKLNENNDETILNEDLIKRIESIVKFLAQKLRPQEKPKNEADLVKEIFVRLKEEMKSQKNFALDLTTNALNNPQDENYSKDSELNKFSQFSSTLNQKIEDYSTKLDKEKDENGKLRESIAGLEGKIKRLSNEKEELGNKLNESYAFPQQLLQPNTFQNLERGKQWFALKGEPLLNKMLGVVEDFAKAEYPVNPFIDKATILEDFLKEEKGRRINKEEIVDENSPVRREKFVSILVKLEREIKEVDRSRRKGSAFDPLFDKFLLQDENGRRGLQYIISAIQDDEKFARILKNDEIDIDGVPINVFHKVFLDNFLLVIIDPLIRLYVYSKIPTDETVKYDYKIIQSEFNSYIDVEALQKCFEEFKDRLCDLFKLELFIPQPFADEFDLKKHELAVSNTLMDLHKSFRDLWKQLPRFTIYDVRRFGFRSKVIEDHDELPQVMAVN